jgi:uncharacterized protein YbdZ (MbtH family)
MPGAQAPGMVTDPSPVGVESVFVFLITEQGETMNREEQEDKTTYKVGVNHEEQYSIWPADRENPLGWRDVGKSGTKEECLAYIK